MTKEEIIEDNKKLEILFKAVMIEKASELMTEPLSEEESKKVDLEAGYMPNDWELDIVKSGLTSKKT